MQGQLRGECLSFTINSICAETGRPIRIEIDSDLNYRTVEGEAGTMLCIPLVDFDKLEDPSIIDAF
ncbi:MAG: hypothetical protein ACK2UY_14630 [Anaerolineae bacterium]